MKQHPKVYRTSLHLALLACTALLGACQSPPPVRAAAVPPENLKQLEGDWVLDEATRDYSCFDALANGGGHFNAQVQGGLLIIKEITDRDLLPSVAGAVPYTKKGNTFVAYRLSLCGKEGRELRGSAGSPHPNTKWRAWGFATEEYAHLHIYCRIPRPGDDYVSFMILRRPHPAVADFRLGTQAVQRK